MESGALAVHCDGMRALIFAVMLAVAPAGAGAQPAPRDETPSREVLEALPPVLEELQREDARRRAEANDGEFEKLAQALERQAEAVEAAINAAIAAEAAGAAPQDALRPIAALQGRSAPLPRLMWDIQTVSPRTMAYLWLTGRYERASPSEGPRPSQALALAAAVAWEAELAGLRGDPMLMFEVERLAKAYAALGEPAPARRVVDLDPRLGPVVRIGLLADARAWDEAADLAARTTVDEVAATLMAERTLEYEAEKAGRSPARARLAALLPQFDGKPDPASLREEAVDALESARHQLVDQARQTAGEATAARIEARLKGGR